MGWWHRAGIAASAAIGSCWPERPVVGDPERAARVAALYRDYREEFTEVPEVEASEVLAARDAGEAWLIVDVRPAAERAVSMVPGAVSLDDLDRDPGLLGRGTVVAYCTVGYRSGRWAQEQRRRGVDARNLVGGVLGWAEAGGAFVDAAGPTTRVHVYGPTWDLLPEGYQSTW